MARNPFQMAEDLLERFPIPRPGPYKIAGRLLLAPAIYVVLMLVVFLVYPDRFNVTLTWTLMDFVVGKFAAVGAVASGKGDFLYWVFMIGSVDVLTGLFLVWNFDLLYRVPGLGPMLRVMEAKGLLFLDKNPWVRRVAFIGVILIVLVPFQGTGAVMGSIVGRLIGLGPWRALGAIAIGGYTGVMLVLSASILVAFLSGLSLWYAVGTVAVLVTAGAAVWWKWFHIRRVKKSDLEPVENVESGQS